MVKSFFKYVNLCHVKNRLFDCVIEFVTFVKNESVFLERSSEDSYFEPFEIWLIQSNCPLRCFMIFDNCCFETLTFASNSWLLLRTHDFCFELMTCCFEIMTFASKCIFILCGFVLNTNTGPTPLSAHVSWRVASVRRP